LIENFVELTLKLKSSMVGFVFTKCLN
jgi:hypothetical protein